MHNLVEDLSPDFQVGNNSPLIVTLTIPPRRWSGMARISCTPTARVTHSDSGFLRSQGSRRCKGRCWNGAGLVLMFGTEWFICCSIAKLKAGKHPKAKPKTPPKEKPQQKPPTVVKAVLPRPAAPANQPAGVSSGAPPETGHAQHGMPLGHNGNAAAAAAIMAAVGMQQPAPNMQQMPLTHISPPLMPQPSPQPIPQAVRPPAGDAYIG